MASVPPVPIRNPVISPNPSDSAQSVWRAVFNDKIVRWLNELRQLIGAAAQMLGMTNLSAQSAAIAPTAIVTPDLSEGLYRASFSVRITRAATMSSSVGVTIGWTFNSTSCSQTFTAVTGNTLASQTSGVINIAVDAGTSVTYSASYSSSGATSMMFALDVWLEQIP